MLPAGDHAFLNTDSSAFGGKLEIQRIAEGHTYQDVLALQAADPFPPRPDWLSNELASFDLSSAPDIDLAENQEVTVRIVAAPIGPIPTISVNVVSTAATASVIRSFDVLNASPSWVIAPMMLREHRTLSRVGSSARAMPSNSSEALLALILTPVPPGVSPARRAWATPDQRSNSPIVFRTSYGDGAGVISQRSR